MKFVCVPCDTPMTLAEKRGPDEGSVTLVYGCDACQIVCPWERFAVQTQESAFHPIDLDYAAPPLAELLAIDERTFAERFSSSPIKRLGRDRLLRNACVAAGNSRSRKLILQLDALAHGDASPLVREHAAWAVERLRVV